MSNPQHYPLTWPSHRPRRKADDRRKGTFVSNGRSITATAAVDKLEDEIERLGGLDPTLSTNMETKMDGRPRADRSPPVDPGVCVYFTLNGEPLAMACDTFTTVQQNIAAIANHINAVRRQEAYGVASAAESLKAFAALPAPGAILMQGGRSWREILGCPPDFPSKTSMGRGDAEATIKLQYRDRAAKAHPDAGGSEAAMSELNAARDAALQEVRS